MFMHSTSRKAHIATSGRNDNYRHVLATRWQRTSRGAMVTRRMVPGHSEYLQQSAEELGVRCVEVPPEIAKIWKQELAAHWQLHSSDTLWADGECVGVPTTEAWRWLARMRGEGPFRVLFPSYDDKRVLEFDSLSDIAASVENSVGRYHFAITRAGFDVVLINDYEGGLCSLGLSQGWFDVPESWTRHTMELPPRER